MINSSIDWHNRFLHQAAWTKPLRDYIFKQIRLERASLILEVGCGTGVLLQDLENRCAATLFGLDLNSDHLAGASQHTPRSHLLQSDARLIPFPSDAFDITFCHFLLLWIKHPLHVIKEMARVTRPGGHVLALAEPDYGGRIDYPFELGLMGTWQQESLRKQGADPLIGRQLADIFIQAGLGNIQTGLLGGEWKSANAGIDWTSEWEILEHDLSYLPQDKDKATQLDMLKDIDKISQESGIRVLYVPTFYAWGRR